MKRNYTVVIESSMIEEIKALAKEASEKSIMKMTQAALARHFITLGMQEYKKGLKDA